MNEDEIKITVDEFDEVHDYKFLDKQLPKIGEKDFEPDGTEFQHDQLTESRELMYNILNDDIKLHVKQVLEGVWLPNEQLTLILQVKGNYFKDIGVNGSFNGKQVIWLNKLESAFLLERGSMIIYKGNEIFYQYLHGVIKKFRIGELPPMSLQEFYSNFSSSDLTKHQVFSYLKRLGYLIQEYKLLYPQSYPKKKGWNFSMGIRFMRSSGITNLKRHHYMTYEEVFEKLNIIPSYRTFDSLKYNPQSEFTITFNVWKPTPVFSKKAPPIPDFQLCICDKFPQLNDIHSLFNQLNFNNKEPISNIPNQKTKDHLLKHGTGRQIILAVVIDGIINFVTLSETDFKLRGDNGKNQGIIH